MTRSPVDAWSLAAVDDDSAPECDAVRRWLREHNHATSPVFMAERERPEHAPRPLVILARGATGVVGGLLAETEFAWLKISIMAVDPAWRSRGIGSALLAEAERQAAQRGCRFAYVDTMDYQAPRFYPERGYETLCCIPDWDSHGHAKLFFRKQIA
jgi:GNAT superfamily N-acetyltransferase